MQFFSLNTRVHPGAGVVLAGALVLGQAKAAAQEVPTPSARSGASPSAASGSISEPSFTSTNWNIGLTLGAGLSLTENHDVATAALHLGRQLDADPGVNSPFLHHLELGLELWGNQQFHPQSAYLIGLTPILRYRLWPDARGTPFLDVGAGFSGTDIDQNDDTAFNVDLLAGVGLQWRWRENVALMMEARYLYLWDANVAFSNEAPNFGSVLFSAGLTWFF